MSKMLKRTKLMLDAREDRLDTLRKSCLETEKQFSAIQEEIDSLLDDITYLEDFYKELESSSEKLKSANAQKKELEKQLAVCINGESDND